MDERMINEIFWDNSNFVMSAWLFGGLFLMLNKIDGGSMFFIMGCVFLLINCFSYWKKSKQAKLTTLEKC